MDIDNRVAVITGASRGIGAGLARHFHQRGMRLGLCARSATALPASDTIVTGAFDIRDEQAVDAFAAEVRERFGHIDVWINNAGVLKPITPLRLCSRDDVQRNLDINVMGVFLGSRAYARQIRQSDRGGVLINISSGAAQSPFAGWSAYCAGKAAVDQMSRCLQQEERDAGLRVHSVAPGIIDTDMQSMIRGCTAEQFPTVDMFVDFKRRDVFNTLEYVAQRLLELALAPTPEQDTVCVSLPHEHPERFG